MILQYMTKIMPTIEDTFKSCIAHYFNKTKATDTTQPLPLEPNAAIQPPTLLQQTTGGSHVLRTSTGNQDRLVDSKPPQTLSALSLTLGVDQKTHAKIQSDEYVKFALLVKQSKIGTNLVFSLHNIFAPSLFYWLYKWTL